MNAKSNECKKIFAGLKYMGYCITIRTEFLPTVGKWLASVFNPKLNFDWNIKVKDIFGNANNKKVLSELTDMDLIYARYKRDKSYSNLYYNYNKRVSLFKFIFEDKWDFKEKSFENVYRRYRLNDTSYDPKLSSDKEKMINASLTKLFTHLKGINNYTYDEVYLHLFDSIINLYVEYYVTTANAKGIEYIIENLGELKLLRLSQYLLSMGSVGHAYATRPHLVTTSSFLIYVYLKYFLENSKLSNSGRKNLLSEFINCVQTELNSGVSKAPITCHTIYANFYNAHKDANDLDYDTILYFNTVLTNGGLTDANRLSLLEQNRNIFYSVMDSCFYDYTLYNAFRSDKDRTCKLVCDYINHSNKKNEEVVKIVNWFFRNFDIDKSKLISVGDNVVTDKKKAILLEMYLL